MVVKYIKPGISVSKPFCDKVSFVINYKSPDARTFVSKKLKGLQNENHKWALSSGKGLYQKAMVLKDAPEGVEGTMLFQWSPWNEKTGFLRVEFNPNVVATHHWKWLFDSILPGGYKDVLALAKVTRCDFAVDVTGVTVDELLVEFGYMQRSKVFSKGGKNQTIQLGSPEAETLVTVYDKVAQLKKLSSSSTDGAVQIPTKPTTRIEIRTRPDSSIGLLPAMNNPFQKLHVQAIKDVETDDDEKFALFVAVCRLEGAQNALKRLSDSTKKSYQKLLKSTDAAWWKPVPLWNDNILELVESTFLCSYAQWKKEHGFST